MTELKPIQAQAKEAADRLEQIVFGNVSTLHTFLLASQLLRRIERGELDEVVRCGECAHRSDQDYEAKYCEPGTLFCDYCGQDREPNDFCSNGRRKSDANG